MMDIRNLLALLTVAVLVSPGIAVGEEAASDREGKQQHSSVSSADIQRLEQKTQAACERAVQCAMEGVPESIRGMIDRGEICRTYRQYDDSIDGQNEECLERAIQYLSCIEHADCDEFKDRDREKVCGSESEMARKACEQ